MVNVLADRSKQKKIGGSDLDSIFNLEPYGCAYRLWANKRGIEPDFPFVETPAMKRGKMLESFIAELYGQQNPDANIEMTPQDLMARLKIPDYFDPHPDFVVWGAKKKILECKSVDQRIFSEIKRTGVIRNSWILQVQLYMYAEGCDTADIAVLKWGGAWEDILILTANRDDALINDVILPACDKFWKLLENGPAPEVLAPEDKRCIQCNRQFQCHGHDVVPFTPRDNEGVEYFDARGDAVIEGAIYGVIEASALVKEAEEVETERKDYLKGLLEKTPAVITKIGKAIYQEVITNRWDTKKLEGSFPDLKKDFCTQTKSRPLRVYPRGGK